jgi:hypothetical protein
MARYNVPHGWNPLTECVSDKECIKFFYTDPLAAAWQAKHFEIKIFTTGLDNGVHPKRIRDWDEDAMSIAEDVARDVATDRYYIHAESMNVLHPRIGDLIVWDAYKDKSWGYGCNVRLNEKHDLSGIWRDIFHDTTGTATNVRIIERAGKLFHRPESDAA